MNKVTLYWDVVHISSLYTATICISVYDCVVFSCYVNRVPFLLNVRVCVRGHRSICVWLHPLARVVVSDASFVYLQSVSTCSYMLTTYIIGASTISCEDGTFNSSQLCTQVCFFFPALFSRCMNPATCTSLMRNYVHVQLFCSSIAGSLTCCIVCIPSVLTLPEVHLYMTVHRYMYMYSNLCVYFIHTVCLSRVKGEGVIGDDVMFGLLLVHC